MDSKREQKTVIESGDRQKIRDFIKNSAPCWVDTILPNGDSGFVLGTAIEEQNDATMSRVTVIGQFKEGGPFRVQISESDFLKWQTEAHIAAN